MFGITQNLNNTINSSHDVAEIYDLDDMRLLKDYALANGYGSFEELRTVLEFWEVPLAVAPDLILRGISFSEYQTNPNIVQRYLKVKEKTLWIC